MRRGEIWGVGGGISAKRPRPALVIQAELFELSESVTVIPMTSQLNDAPLFRVRISATEATGLRSDNDVTIDKITTVKQKNATDRLGKVSSNDLVSIKRLMLAHLGIASGQSRNSGNSGDPRRE